MSASLVPASVRPCACDASDAARLMRAGEGAASPAPASPDEVPAGAADESDSESDAEKDAESDGVQSASEA